MSNFFTTLNNFRTKRNIQDNQNAMINSRNLYEDVVRKNQEIIKQILSKINDLYSRQEEFDCNIKLINDKLVKMDETTEELHRQFRSNHIEIERKHQVLLNDLVKEVLKRPELSQNHQDYLQSDFFKQQAALVNIRTRSRKARHKTNLTNENVQQLDKYQKKTSNFMNCQGKVKPFSQAKIAEKAQVEVEEYFQLQDQVQISNAYAEVESKVCKQDDDRYQDGIKQKIEALQQKLQASLINSNEQIKMKNMELAQTIKNLQNHLLAKMEKIQVNAKQQHSLEQINFEQLHGYIQVKVKQELHQKISKKYFEESLNNLKQTWQQELDQAYLHINSKVSQDNLINIQQKINELKTQIELFNNLNSIKIQNISYNSTCKSTPQRHSPRERKSTGQAIDNIRNTREQDDNKKYKKNELSHSSSYSSIFKVRKTNDDKNTTLCADQQSVFRWKGKVMETLGLTNKKVRRVKRGD